MLIRSDWHNHSEYSHDSTLPLKTLAEKADEYGFCRIGVTDHVNFNDAFFLNNLDSSASATNALPGPTILSTLGMVCVP